MPSRQSIKMAVKQAQSQDRKLRQGLHDGGGVSTVDSFVNFAHKLGIGADNPLSSGSYGFNPITRNRTLLEWIHRGSWLGGVAVDLVADDMTRSGIQVLSEIAPDDLQDMERCATALNVWGALNETIQWGRLYGGAIAVALIDGHDLRQPLRLEAVGKGQFRGLLPLDRWMIEPSLEDLVTELGPHLGLPKYYRVQANAPALRGQAIHHSRVVLRHEGIRVPYQQRLTENLWGISVLERLYDRMIAFDSATTGTAQLVYKSYLRTLKVAELRQIVAQGGAAMEGLVKYVDMMRRFQGIEGITMVDAEDEFQADTHGAFSGLDDVLHQLGQQLSGALQIPLVRLFGQSPAGLNATGESDLRTYYDHIQQQQQKTMHTGVTLTYKLIGASEGIRLEDDFNLAFRSLWQLTDEEKATIGKQNAETVSAAFDALLIGRQTALRELRQQSRVSGLFTNITEEMINEADDEIEPPIPPGMEGGFELGEPGELKDDDDAQAGPKGPQGNVGSRPRKRVKIQPQPSTGSETDRGDT